MLTLWKCLLWAMIAVRVVLLAVLVGRGNWHVAAAEGAALWFGIRNGLEAKPFLTLSSLWCPVAYGIGVFLLPRPVHPNAAGLLLSVVGLGLTTWALWNLREAFSVAAPGWVRLVQSGPYRIIRHPQLLARVLMVVGVGLQVETLADQVRCVACVLLTLTVALSEEWQLSKVPVWQTYSKRVRARVVPGVW